MDAEELDLAVDNVDDPDVFLNDDHCSLLEMQNTQNQTQSNNYFQPFSQGFTGMMTVDEQAQTFGSNTPMNIHSQLKEINTNSQPAQIPY